MTASQPVRLIETAFRQMASGCDAANRPKSFGSYSGDVSDVYDEISGWLVVYAVATVVAGCAILIAESADILRQGARIMNETALTNVNVNDLEWTYATGTG